MCGITGIVSIDGSPIGVSPQVFAERVESLRHRGPDAEGIHLDSLFFFGHRRLSILDLSETGRQPMSDGEQRIFLTYNGEIYNYLELREELLKMGHSFRSRSDSEVIIEAYKAWGISCLNRFNGMFAFGLYDKRKQEFYLCRDQAGIKPVYHAISQQCLLFASELKGIIDYPGFGRVLNKRAVSSFLSYRYVVGDETLFEGVHQLEPGHYLSVKSGRVEVRQYWDVDLAEPMIDDFGTARQHLRESIGDAVKHHLRSDIPVGTLLSGGLDSSIILALASPHTDKPIRSFSVTFDNKKFDETFYSDLVAKMYGSPNEKLTVQPGQYIDELRNYLKFKDQPAGMHNELALYLMMRQIKPKVSVILSGEGADELFSGYGRLFRSPYDLGRLQRLGRWPGFVARPTARMMGLDPSMLGKSEYDHFHQHYGYFPDEIKFALFNKDTKAAVQGDAELRLRFKRCFEKAHMRNYHDKIAYLFLKMHLPGLLLMMDATSMSSGVEVRVPFLDHRVIQAAFRIPSKFKLKWKSAGHNLLGFFKPASKISERHDITKYILKSAFRDVLPPQVIDRKKMPFPVPLNDWFSSDLNRAMREILLRDDARINEIFDRAALQKWITDPAYQQEAYHGRRIWLVLNLEIWLQLYMNQNNPIK